MRLVLQSTFDSLSSIHKIHSSKKWNTIQLTVLICSHHKVQELRMTLADWKLNKIRETISVLNRRLHALEVIGDLKPEKMHRGALCTCQTSSLIWKPRPCLKKTQVSWAHRSWIFKKNLQIRLPFFQQSDIKSSIFTTLKGCGSIISITKKGFLPSNPNLVSCKRRVDSDLFHSTDVVSPYLLLVTTSMFLDSACIYQPLTRKRPAKIKKKHQVKHYTTAIGDSLKFFKINSFKLVWVPSPSSNAPLEVLVSNWFLQAFCRRFWTSKTGRDLLVL